MKHTPVLWLAAGFLGMAGFTGRDGEREGPRSSSNELVGLLTDSVSASRTWHGVEVSLMPGARRAVADSAGRFRFESIDDGEYSVAAAPPFLDSIGAMPLRVRVRVSGGQTRQIVLATPSIPTLQRALCGRAVPADEGVLFGEVRSAIGEPVAFEPVVARWSVTTIARGAVQQSAVAVVDTTTVGGRYALCGVPRDDRFSLHAIGRSRASGTLVHAQGGLAIVRRDIVVAANSEMVRVVGQLTNDKGDRVGSALVMVADDSSRNAVSDSSGRFVLEVAPRSQQLSVRAIGYAPSLVDIEPRGEPRLGVSHVLTAIDVNGAQSLSAVRISAERTTARRAEFEERRRYETGYFLDDETLAEQPLRTTAIIQFPRIRYRNGNVYLAQGAGFCSPRWFIDGADMKDSIKWPETDYWVRLAKRIEVYRAAFAPPRFTDFDGCGVVLIWTQ